ncbi:hypothetical protein C8J56DRAFT_1013055 [Mycena floridula]|nr:hypothetical protein C8J56DRAFT_1013055 [Mycena floridula]
MFSKGTLLWLSLASGLAATPDVADVAQQPLAKLSEIGMIEKWDLSRAPSVNSTGNLVFATASSFLQHWGNTRYRNGHNLLLGTVPVNTLLYHGRRDEYVPTVPDWLAVDPEHSMLFCRSMNNTGCWHLTLVAARPLKVLYFDGSSAAKMEDGPMDTQDIVAWRKVLPQYFFDERRRLDDLCSWGKRFGLDGFVRMEMDFEIMMCNFTNGLEIVSMLDLHSESRPRFSPERPNLHRDNSHGPEELFAGFRHNHVPDSRIRLDYSSLISFYDTDLVPSLVNSRFGVTRLEHRLLGISDRDVEAVMDRLEFILSDEPRVNSGIDWETLLNVVQHRFAERLEILQYLLNTTSPEGYISRAKQSQYQLHVMLQPYILRASIPEASVSTGWAEPIFRLCSTSHTAFITSSQRIQDSLTSGERLLLRAVDETNREICRTIVNLWVEGVQLGLDSSVELPGSPKAPEIDEVVPRWRDEINRLTKWLDFAIFVKCQPACDSESVCYLPTWPFFGNRPRPPRGEFPPPSEPDMLLDEIWKDPQPVCMRRMEPYEVPTFTT